MGNLPSRAIGAPTPPTTLDSYVAELGGDITYQASIGHSRFLKTIKASHPNGPLVVKVFVKADPGLSLLVHRRRLKADRELLASIPNVYPYQAMVETDRAAYLVRQYLANDLYDRISTRPFLAEIEKKWLAFQLLVGMSEIRARKLSHGDLKPSNVLVSSSLHLLITDLSPFKPVYLPEDDPADFSFFFAPAPGGSSRACYLAPERFFAAGSKAEERRRAANLEQGKRDGKVTEPMDIFAAGAVVAELWTDGRELFDLSGMLAFRKGQSSPESIVRLIPDAAVQDMVRQMTALAPADRPSFAGVLSAFRGRVFPEIFYLFLHDYACALAEVRPATFMAAEAPDAAQPTADGEATSSKPMLAMSGAATGAGGRETARRSTVADDKVGQLWEDWDSIKSYLDTDAGESVGGGGEAGGGIQHDGPALLLLGMLTSELRSCHRPTSLVRAMDLILRLGRYITDEARLDRAVPFLADLLADERPAVRVGAVRSLTTLLETVQIVSPTNMALVTDFVLPQVRPLGYDDEVEVRVAYASCLAGLTETGERFLDLSESFRSLGGRDDGIGAGDVEEVSYDQARDELQALLQVELTTLLSDPSPFVKRAVLADITTFCLFLGRQTTDDVLLSHMLTFLNDGDWRLRCDFFESVVGVGALIGSAGLEALVLPLLLQALADPEEAVLSRVLSSMRALTDLGLFGRRRLWEIASACLGLLLHPNVWIRHTVAGLLSAIAKRLPVTDQWCILYPSIRPHLRSETVSLSESILLDALLSPIPRPAFDAALQWGTKATTSPFWSLTQPPIKVGGSGTVARNARSGSLGLLPDSTEAIMSEEDEKALAALRQKGLTDGDESRLISMRAQLLKLARRQQSPPGPEATFSDSPATLEVVPLNSLGITPRNIFFNIQPSGPAAVSRRLKGRAPSRAVLLERRPSTMSDGGRSSAAEPLSLSRLRPIAPVIDNLPLPSLVPASSVPPSETALSISQHSQARSPNGKSAPQVGVALTTASALIDSQSERPLEESEAEVISASSSPGPKEAPFEGAPARMSRDRIQGYDGTDPNIIHFLEVAYLDSLKESAHDFGPRISPAAAVSSRRKASANRTTVGSRASAGAQENAPFSFLEAGSPVVHLVASPDQIFFVTTHRDNSLRVWDTARLERNVSSKPRLVHQLGAPPTVVCFVEDTHCLAVASMDGAVVILRVHISSPYSHPKFREVELVRFFQCESAGEYAVALCSVSAADGSMELVLATVGSSIVTLELCSLRVLRTFTLPLNQGPPSCVYADRGRQWVAIGTSLGILSVWDARFALPVRTWSASTTGRVRFCLRHPLKSRWVLVAAESADETFLQSYEVESGRLMETFTTSGSSATAAPHPSASLPDSLVTLAPAVSDADIDKAMAQILAARSRQRSSPPLTPVSAVLAIAVQSRAHQSTGLRNEGVVSGPTVFTAGLSGRIRCLNFADLQRSRMLAPPGSEVKASYFHSTGTVAVTHETVTSAAYSGQSEAIASLCVVASPVSSTVWLLSASLTGSLQAWKV